MFKLDYYRLVPDINPVAAMDEPGVDCNYTPYHIFVLETRLFPLVYSLYPEASPTFESRYENGRMEAYLVLSRQELAQDDFTINPPLEVSKEAREQIEKKIQEIKNLDPEYVLINSDELYQTTDKQIPKRYFQQMMGYVGQTQVVESSEYETEPKVKPDGLDISVYNPYLAPEGIYLSFKPNSDFRAAYRQVTQYIVEKITENYQTGTVVLANVARSVDKNRLIVNWKLKPLTTNEEITTLYGVTWTDQRFAPDITAFLTSRILGENTIRVWVGENMVTRYFVSIYLKEYGMKLVDYQMKGNYVEIRVDNLLEAQRYASIVEMAIGQSSGQVLALASHRLADVILYQKHSERIYPDMKTTIYRQGDDYFFSTLLPDYVDDLESIRQSFRQNAVDQLVNVSKISKFKSSSPHNIIEQEYGVEL